MWSVANIGQFSAKSSHFVGAFLNRYNLVLLLMCFFEWLNMKNCLYLREVSWIGVAIEGGGAWK